MQKYKDLNNKVHDINENFEHLLPVGSVKITDAEAAELRKRPPETPEQANARKDAQVDRELGTDVVRILIETLVPLINPGLNATTIINQAKAKRRGEL